MFNVLSQEGLLEAHKDKMHNQYYMSLVRSFNRAKVAKIDNSPEFRNLLENAMTEFESNVSRLTDSEVNALKERSDIVKHTSFKKKEAKIGLERFSLNESADEEMSPLLESQYFGLHPNMEKVTELLTPYCLGGTKIISSLSGKKALIEIEKLIGDTFGFKDVFIGVADDKMIAGAIYASVMTYAYTSDPLTVSIFRRADDVEKNAYDNGGVFGLQKVKQKQAPSVPTSNPGGFDDYEDAGVAFQVATSPESAKDASIDHDTAILTSQYQKSVQRGWSGDVVAFGGMVQALNTLALYKMAKGYYNITTKSNAFTLNFPNFDRLIDRLTTSITGKDPYVFYDISKEGFKIKPSVKMNFVMSFTGSFVNDHTAPEIVSAILHEVGHNFFIVNTKNSLVLRIVVVVSTLHNLMFKIIAAVLSPFLSIVFRFVSTIFGYLRNLLERVIGETNFTVLNKILNSVYTLSTYIEKFLTTIWRFSFVSNFTIWAKAASFEYFKSFLKSNFFEKALSYNEEQFADDFAVAHGAGTGIASMFSKGGSTSGIYLGSKVFNKDGSTIASDADSNLLNYALFIGNLPANLIYMVGDIAEVHPTAITRIRSSISLLERMELSTTDSNKKKILKDQITAAKKSLTILKTNMAAGIGGIETVDTIIDTLKEIVLPASATSVVNSFR
jgi:hypothetical protein